MALYKRFFKTVLLTAVAMGFILVNNLVSRYSLRVRVISVENDLVSVVDKAGNLWGFYGTDCMVCDDITVVVFNNYNDDISDDVIVGFSK